MQWYAEILGFTCKFEALIDKPESLNLGFEAKVRFTNPGIQDEINPLLKNRASKI